MVRTWLLLLVLLGTGFGCTSNDDAESGSNAGRTKKHQMADADASASKGGKSDDDGAEQASGDGGSADDDAKDSDDDVSDDDTASDDDALDDDVASDDDTASDDDIGGQDDDTVDVGQSDDDTANDDDGNDDSASNDDDATSSDGDPADAGSAGLGQGSNDAGAPEPEPPVVVPKPEPCEVMAPTACPDPMPHYADIQPIVHDRCLVCHKGEADGPWTLNGYEHLANWHDLIRAAMVSCTMPPPDSGYTMLVEERVRILEWLRCGFPE